MIEFLLKYKIIIKFIIFFYEKYFFLIYQFEFKYAWDLG